jgi:hypothetical protein
MTPAAQSFLGVFKPLQGLSGVWFGGFNLFVKIALNYAFKCVKPVNQSLILHLASLKVIHMAFNRKVRELTNGSGQRAASMTESRSALRAEWITKPLPSGPPGL